ncbi:MAG: tetratricopeptide repeat protein [Acidobacteria bacterium]|nr:tetratricopeptide repeat protein [Acidobacteriota bacterium]
MTAPDLDLERLRGVLGDGPTGSSCASPEVIWQAVAGRLDREQVAALLDHSTTCGTCAQAWMLAREFAVEMPEIEAPTRPVPAYREWSARRTLALAAGVVLVIGTVLLVGFRAGFLGGRETRVAGGPTASPWRDLPVEPAPFADPGPAGTVWRGDGAAVAPDAAAELRMAMQPYGAGDYVEAARRLTGLLDAHPDLHEARFFLGVSLLLAGREGESAAQLDQVVKAGGASPPPEHRWYLALALLKAGRPGDALSQLDVIVRQGGAFASRAAELRAQARGMSETGT